VISLSLVTSNIMFSSDIIIPENKIQTELLEIKMQLLNTKKPLKISVFLEKIQEMLKNLEEEQTRHEKLNIKMTKQCTVEENFRTIEISNAKDAFNTSSESEVKCRASLDEAKGFLPILEKSVKNYKNQIKTKTEDRKTQHKKYLELKGQWDAAITFLKKFIVMVQAEIDGKVKHDVSFVEVNEKLIKHVGNLGRLDKLAPIFIEMEALAVTQSSAAKNSTAAIVKKTIKTYSTTTKNKRLAKILQLVTDLSTKMMSDSKQNDTEENQAVKNFEALVKKFSEILKEISANVKKVKAQIIKMNSCVKTEDAVMVIASEKLTRNEKLLQIADKTCLDFVKGFVSATKNRYREIKSIKDILVIVEKRFGEFPSSLKAMLSNLKAKFKNIVNQTQFVKYEEIVKTTFKDNKRGKILSNK